MVYNKVQSASVLISSILALFIGVSVVLNSFARQSVLNSSEEDSSLESDNSKEGYFELNNFDRFEVKQGLLSWRIKADKARYFAKDKLTQIVGAVVNFNRSDGSTLQVSSERAKIIGEDKGAKKAELEGNVKVFVSDGINVFSQYAIYEANDSKIILPENSIINGTGFQVSGNSMDIFIDDKSINVRGEVESIFQPDAKLPKKLKLK